MHRLLLVISVFMFSSLSAQVYTSNCSHTALMERIYNTDVYKLAITRLNETQNTYKDSIEIPQVVLDSIANALYAVYNMPETSFKDTIMNLFGFSDFASSSSYPTGYPQYEVDSAHILSTGFGANTVRSFMRIFKVNISDGASFATAWGAGNYNATPDEDINNIVTRYNLSITKNNSTYTIIVPRVINLPALKNWFANHAGVTNAQLINFIGDGNYITTTFSGDTVLITYRAGCGDCPAGCTFQDKWYFKIYNNCTVEYLGTLGATAEPFPTCPALRGNIMPVTLSPLSASLLKNDVVLKWSALTEINMKQYVVERSLTGNQFTQIATRQAVNNNSMTYDYSFTDVNVQGEKLYYRIKAIDKSGEIKYTNTVVIAKTNARAVVKVFPNPLTNGKLQLQFTGLPQGKYNCSFYSITGQKLYAKDCFIQAGFSTAEIALPFKPKGTLLLVIKDEKGAGVLNTMLTTK